jgi:pimeloyl-ACP methyl ester carboxylesterase
MLFIFIIKTNAKDDTSSINDKNADVTILTPGLGSTYHTWSHTNKEYFEFVYNEESIVAKLGERLNGNLDIYIAKCKNNYSYDLYYLSYNDYKNNNEETEIDNMLNNNNHKILLFDPSKARLGLDDTYEEFHYMVDDFSELYNDIYNVYPTFNLIAHSRGGIVNMLYSIDHPYNVKKVYSLASPYGAINIAKPTTLLDAFGLDSVVDDIKEDQGAADVLNEEKNIQIRNNWNKMLKEYNPDIDYYAFAYIENIPFLYRVIESLLDPNNNKHFLTEYVNMEYVEDVIKFIDNNQYMIHKIINCIIEPMKFMEEFLNIKVFDKLFKFFGFKYEGHITLNDMQYLFDCFSYDSKTKQILILQDGLVDVKSALGISFDDGIKYEGFNRYIKLLDISDTYCTLTSPNEPIVGHNIAVYDEDTINFIVANLEFNDNKTKNIDEFINLKELNYYRYSIM